jgi:hypothetical protein
MSNPPATPNRVAIERWLIPALILAYIGLGFYRFDDAPVICNDAAQEVMSGYLNLFGGSPQVMTFFPSDNGVETLWVGVAGVLIAFLGQETIAAVMSSNIAVGLMLFFIWRLAERHRDVIHPLLTVLAAMSMLWVFHYARGSMRAISAATFLACNLWALSIFLQSPRGLRGPILLGGSLALGIYAYTTSRVPPLMYVLFVLIHLAVVFRRHRHEFSRWMIQHALTIAAAVVVSVPNILYAWHSPGQFFKRGSYNIRGDAVPTFDFVIDSLLVPVTYSADKYSKVATDQWLFDVVACTLPGLGLPPVPLIVGLAMLAGILMLKQYRPMLGVVGFAAGVYLLSCTLIGFMGPSLSRIAIVIPVIAIFAGVGVTSAARAVPRFGVPIVAAALLAVTAFGITRYFDRIGPTQFDFGFGLTAREIGRAARNDVRAGRMVLVVLSKDVNTLRYYAQETFPDLTVLDLYGREFTPALLPEPFLGNFDRIYVSQDQEPDRSDRLPRQTSEARTWLDKHLPEPRFDEVGRFFVYDSRPTHSTTRPGND